MFKTVLRTTFCFLLATGSGIAVAQQQGTIIHDSEYYILEAQNGKVWEVEDGELDLEQV